MKNNIRETHILDQDFDNILSAVDDPISVINQRRIENSGLKEDRYLEMNNSKSGKRHIANQIRSQNPSPINKKKTLRSNTSKARNETIEGDLESIIDDAFNRKREKISETDQILQTGGGNISRSKKGSRLSFDNDGLQQLIDMAKLRRQENNLNNTKERFVLPQIRNNSSNIKKESSTKNNYVDDETPWTHRVKTVIATTANTPQNMLGPGLTQNNPKVPNINTTQSFNNTKIDPSPQITKMKISDQTPDHSMISFDNTMQIQKDGAKVFNRGSHLFKDGLNQGIKGVHSLDNQTENDVPVQGQGGYVVKKKRQSKVTNNQIEIIKPSDSVNNQNDSVVSQDDKLQQHQLDNMKLLPIKKYKNDLDTTSQLQLNSQRSKSSLQNEKLISSSREFNNNLGGSFNHKNGRDRERGGSLNNKSSHHHHHQERPRDQNPNNISSTLSPTRHKRSHRNNSVGKKKDQGQSQNGIYLQQDQTESMIQKKNVHFKDEVEGNSLCDVVVIESYKKYYNNGNQASCSCFCSIF
ncbi:UNKNOWN [Stylonychia lemnae]|uniref:Uncharacterized protein n=1 Tax=Stylonychia lemnae TaxID=5949 RepID=A0A078AK43_STYLE|nr:UNKNOWN [Stylonychia lemnae]|eukprot:CDW81173.1 UNKNOWN [Stylonychia lemnae]